MRVTDFIREVDNICGYFYTGVPDSLLKPLCDYLENGYAGVHMPAPNEGGAVALASGYYLSTGKIPVVYMQNSGIGNALNPIVSLTNDKVYGIPMVFIVGYRGEPGVKDEPQHIYQGEITEKLLEVIDVKPFVISAETKCLELKAMINEIKTRADNKKSSAFVVKKNTFTLGCGYPKEETLSISREVCLEAVVDSLDDKDIVYSTTGKASRELFEIRENRNMGHSRDFLTVGSMGHCSLIALSTATFKKDRQIVCIDGDGAVLMHLGAMALIGERKPKNFIHIVINNRSHETVGGMSTSAVNTDFCAVASALGYENCIRCEDTEQIKEAILKARGKLSLIEIMTNTHSRDDLTRPTISPSDNKIDFMKFVKGQ